MNFIKMTVLFAALTALIVVLADLIGQNYGGVTVGNKYALIALIICGVINFVVYWFSDKIVLRMYKARPIGPYDAPKLYKIVERLTQKARLPMPKVYLIPTDSPNAFATGRNPSNAAVAATRGIIKLLSDDELEGVMAHELAHVKNRDTLISCVAATLGGAIGYLAQILFYSGGRGRNRSSGGGAAALIGIAVMILAPLIAAMIQMAISRGREYVADRDGAHICGNPNALASALERLHSGVAAKPMPENIGSPATSHLCIVNPFSGGAMNKLFSTHPPTEERVSRLRAMRV